MSKLILPDSEPTNAQLIVPSRRSFIRGTATAVAGLFVAPAIVPAANLMQIHSPDNRLIVVFQRGMVSFPSYLNLTDYTEAGFRAWEVIHYMNKYSLMRKGNILPENRDKIGGREWHPHGANALERQLDRKEQLAAVRQGVIEDIQRYYDNPVYRSRCDKLHSFTLR